MNARAQRVDAKAEAKLARRSLISGRLLAFLALAVSALVLRTAVTSITPLLGDISDDIGFNSTIVGVFGMLPTAMFAVFGLLTPLLVIRWDLERVAILAMVMAGAGMLARAMVNDTGSLLALSALALGGMGIGNVVIPPLVKRYFSDRVAVMSAVYIMGVQLGTAIPPLLAVPVADALGWRFSIGMWAIVAAAALLPCVGLWLSRRTATASGTETDARPTRAVAGTRLSRTSLSWGMAVMFGMTSLITYSMFTWLPRILSDAGADKAFGGSMVALFSAMGFIAALGAPALCARVYNPFPIVLVCVAAYLVGFAGLYFAPMSVPVLWVILVGLGPSTFPMALTLINLRTRTQSGASRLSGFTQGLGYTVACLGPLLFGVLRDQTGGWGWPFAMLLVAVAFMVTGAYYACKPRMLEDLW
ncbi:MFS transporter [Tomitella biformata]|uniref:MFS transporter n=1 Tax=Tomitella biformata TaxID=630403 RepID=UPI0004654DCD|nr:MFS transporter [Tomitella biformata]